MRPSAFSSIFLLFCGFFQTTPALAQDIYEQFVIRELRSRISVHAPSGYYLMRSPDVRKLRSGRRDRLNVTLQSGSDYWIIGVCDQDCLDIDLQLYDQNQSLIDEDLLLDDFPIVRVSPLWTGPFTIIVTIPDCRAAYCTYGVAVLER